MNCPKCHAENSPEALFCSKCGSQLPQPDNPVSLGALPTLREARTRRFKTGDVILGRYRVSGELGQGGMGVVYKCFDIIGGIEVALKALPPELSHNSIEMEEVRENFRIVEKLHHPNIAAVKTLERDPATGDYYLILESVEGTDLRRWRKQRGGKVSLDDALSLLRQVAAALDYAHTEKIIHRDIKPSNVMVRPDGTVKLLDFGLAAQIQSSLARVSQVKYGTSGTGPYMAPEQWRGQYQDAATDQYALAVMAYELLSGRLPFDSPDPTVLQQAILNTAAEPPEGVAGNGWPSLARALAKQRGERFGHCAAFVQALAGGNPGEGAGDKTENRRPKLEAKQKAESGKQKSHKSLVVGLAIAVVLLLGLGGWYFGLHVPEQRRKTDLARSTGSLRMGSTPEGAEFTLESNGDVFDQVESGTRRGTTPAELSSLPTGEYRYVIKRGDWEQRGTVMVERNATAEARVEFAYGSVRLTSEPSGATVVQGSRTLGQTPLTLTEQRPGAVSYTLSLPKHKPASVSGTVEAKRELALAARLENAAYPTLEQPYENTLGMKFVPVAGTEVLFCAWETRVQDYAAYAQANPGVDGSWRNPGFTQGDTHPVVNVSWNDAKAFCEWLTRSERAGGKIGPEQSYRLPGDCEWSVAVGLNESRGGTPQSKDEQIKDVYPWGTGWPPPQGAGNYGISLGVASYDWTAPVGNFAANRYDLYDLGGNVWEWCEDYYDGNSGNRVLRGGSCLNDDTRFLLSSNRNSVVPDFRIGIVGFRCVLVCGSAPR